VTGGDDLMTGIFISYRRVDSGQYAGRLYDALVSHFGRDHVFFDVDTINPGEDFREVIRRTCSSCDVLLAIIGTQWATARDKHGELCLNSTRDYPRFEIATALERGLRVIPVLVGGAEMPDESVLPEDLKPLLYRNAWEISEKRFHPDAQLLIEALKKSSKPPPATATAPEPTPASSKRPSLFPLYGVILGKTTVSQILALGGKQPFYIDGMYELNGASFFPDTSKTMIHSMIVSTTDPMPEPWEVLGFSWQNSFQEWSRLLQGLGYSVNTQTRNKFMRMMTDDSYSARVSGHMVGPHAHRIAIRYRPVDGASSIGILKDIYCTSL
jgi:hypothetical protein